MKFLNIVKNGITNVVDEVLYNAVYKPAGWKIGGESGLKVETTNAPDDEVKKKNINRMKKVAAKPFDDNLI